jgi:uncharacterized membrane protein (UPF0127 family)
MTNPTAPGKVCVFNQTRQSFLSMGVTVADSHLARLKGLLGRRKLPANEGLWVAPSQGVHTIGMLFAIDVIYLDADNRVIHLVEDLRPFRVSRVKMTGASVLELPVRTIFESETQVGDELVICSAAEMEIHWKAQQLHKAFAR